MRYRIYLYTYVNVTPSAYEQKIAQHVRKPDTRELGQDWRNFPRTEASQFLGPTEAP